jgi:5,10-methylenetetrahydromethanopterin reductase
MELAGRGADGVILAEPVTPEYLAVVRARLASARRPDSSNPGFSDPSSSNLRVVAYNVASIDDKDPDRARHDARAALQWIGEPDWAPHIRPLDFADDLFALRARCADRREFASRLPDEWVDRLAVTGTASDGRARVVALHNGGTDSVVLVPAGVDRVAALDHLARLLPARRQTP